jgi:hypothetical protein
MKNPKEFTDVLENKHEFKLKGTGPIAFHLGMDFTRHDGTLCISPMKYMEKLIKNYEKSFGIKPKELASPLEKGDHPELDTSELCTTEQVAQYQSMIGSLQWIFTIGRFDTYSSNNYVWVSYCHQNQAPREITAYIRLLIKNEIRVNMCQNLRTRLFQCIRPSVQLDVYSIQ